jgi:murein DD-endopeptidase MepM/ murein hydrolase activator NlpD
MRARRVLGLLIAVWLTGSGAWSGNDVLNGYFDTDVSGWTADSSASVAWSVVDANLSPTSGSAEVTNSHPNPSNGTGIHQCLNVSPVEGATYDYGGKAFIPDAQTRTGKAYLGLRWLAGPNCTGATVGSQPRLSTSTIGQWVQLTAVEQVVPPGAVSVLFKAFPSKVEAGGTLISHFDDLYFRKTPVFADGFESGDLRVWSSTTQSILDLPPYADQSEMAGLLWPYCDSGSCPPPLQTHDGLDFTPNQNLAVFHAAAPGVVTNVDPYFNPGNGYWQVNVAVAYAHDHTHGLNYAFEPMGDSTGDRDAQLAEIDVMVGQAVALGDVIGRLVVVGEHAHLHFGLFEDFDQVCPEPFMSEAVRTELRDLIQSEPGHEDWEICN